MSSSIAQEAAESAGRASRAPRPVMAWVITAMLVLFTVINWADKAFSAWSLSRWPRNWVSLRRRSV